MLVEITSERRDRGASVRVRELVRDPLITICLCEPRAQPTLRDGIRECERVMPVLAKLGAHVTAGWFCEAGPHLAKTDHAEGAEVVPSGDESRRVVGGTTLGL